MANQDQPDSSGYYDHISDRGKSIFVIKKELTESEWSAIDQVGQEILKTVEESPDPQVMLDMSDLSYMGSAMVALLLRIWKEVNARDGKMVFVNKEEGIHDILRLAGLTKVWTICDTREEASKHLITPLEQTGRTLSPLLVFAALISTFVGVAAYVMLHFENFGVDASILGKLQIAGSIVGLVLTLWVIKSTKGTSRFAGLLLLLLAATVLSLGFLDFRIPGLGTPEAERKIHQSSAPAVELGESESSDVDPDNPFGDPESKVEEKAEQETDSSEAENQPDPQAPSNTSSTEAESDSSPPDNKTE